ncbi:hypothetical protein RJ640_007712 [Escallonia rubra]|uniref:Retrovirus-related Pol polyprotein from transposon TNT 1-94-like beta-barrel domain-containing protein n=1 Tax=Escallonia rubra TaxID=112253 RepID=A0AA88RMH5_9ASTE|nr:hypothetical protein RJ640_007712 [Escallonia rubra]
MDNFKTTDAGVVEDNFDGAGILLVTISSSNGGWILDTGCSYHMCPNRDRFATYRSFDGGKGSTITGATATATATTSSYSIDFDLPSYDKEDSSHSIEESEEPQE